MRVIIAPDKFKGSLTALAAAEAISRGILRVCPNAIPISVPIADGGEGTAEAICAALGGKWISLRAQDPLGREVAARYAWLNGEIAVIDMSEASGLWRLTQDERDPLRASTFGTGQLIADALRHGAKKILVGLGGSATNDGGIGMAEALGFRFFDDAGKVIRAIPLHIPQLARIEPPASPITVEIVALSDVGNPLTGERGASRMFGPQKGAAPEQVEFLDAALEHLANIAAKDLGCDHRNASGAGAAGGLGFGLMTFCNAGIRSGFETLAKILDLERHIATCDLVFTGEGRMDSQTLEGKGPAGVARLAHKHGKPVIAFAGSVQDTSRLSEIFDATNAITPAGMPLKEALLKAPQLLEESVVQTIGPFANR